MKTAVIFSFSARGRETALYLATVLDEKYECQLFAPEKYEEGRVKALPDRIGIFTGKVFAHTDVLIYVGACGIAVRAIAPYIKSKVVDPAIICVDERATFCISLLSGHIGGGNQLTRELAEKIHAIPVITTATDINHRFSVDEWASRKGFWIEDMTVAKEVSSAILEKNVPICSDKAITGELPKGLLIDETGNIGISVSIYQKRPFDKTLAIVPSVLTLGIGCRRGTPLEKIEEAVRKVFQEQRLNWHAIEKVASIDLKAEEQGLQVFCEKYAIPAIFYTAEQLSKVQGKFTRSDFVQKVTGVDNVCERSAVASGGRLIVKKTACDGVTVAVAERDWVLDFG